MKKVIEMVKVVVDEIKKDIGIYLTIQKYSRTSRKAERTV